MKTGFTDRDISDMTAQDFGLVFPLIKCRLFELGLYETGRAFDKAQQVIGWEIAKHLAHDHDKSAP